MSDEIKKYSVQECILAIRSDPDSQYGFKDDQVMKIFLDTEIRSEEDISIILREMLSFRINLIDRICEELSKRRSVLENKKPPN
ncbi:MAG: hypothetical protein ACYC3G_03680 [Minisyncoccota bacterium]